MEGCGANGDNTRRHFGFPAEKGFDVCPFQWRGRVGCCGGDEITGCVV